MKSINLKEDLFRHLSDCVNLVDKLNSVLCAEINYDDYKGDNISISLSIGGDIQEFLNELDIYVSFYLINDGTIWYNDRTWSTYDYDSYFCKPMWTNNKSPNVPEYLK